MPGEMTARLARFFKFPDFIRLTPDMEARFQKAARENFVPFFRTALLFGILVYLVFIAWDFAASGEVFLQILPARLVMIGLFGAGLLATFHSRAPAYAQYVGMAFILLIMLNVTVVQTIMEHELESGYGMLITPGSASSIIVFSGVELGYGILLTPMLLLPIAFSAGHALITVTLAIVIVNAGMWYNDLPRAFVYTGNSIFICIGLFSVILAWLVNQQRRAAFQLRHDLMKAKQEAEQASAAKSAFLATMSHEVRTPLNGVLGIVNLLEDTRLDMKQRGYTETIRYSGEALMTMLNDVLDFSKIESGKMEIENIDFSINRLLHSVVELMRSRAQEKGLDLQLRINLDVPIHVNADSTRLRQILLNLLSNAIKFTDQGHVALKVSNLFEEGWNCRLRFEVEDTGVGIPEEAQQHLFQDFTQSDGSITRRYGGTGLGLAICRRIADLMGGEMGVRSAPETGSVFWLDMPAGIADEGLIPNDGEPEDSVPDPPETLPMQILLVEDNAINQTVADGLLRKQGHHVTFANNGAEALEILGEQNNFDIILMDMHMPVMDGLTATRKIREMDGPAAEIPIIAMTANVMQDDLHKCFAAGMSDHIAKPIDPREMYNKIAVHAPDSLYRAHGPVAAHELVETLSSPAGISDRIDLSALDKISKILGLEYVGKVMNEYVPQLETYIHLTASSQGDAAAMLHHAHELKGLCAMFGLKDAAAIAEGIERCAQNGDIEEANALARLLPGRFAENMAALRKAYPV